MTKHSNLKATSSASGVAAASARLSTAETFQAGPAFRRPRTILPVATPAAKYQHLEKGAPDTQLTRETTGLPGVQHASALQPFSPRLLLGQ